MKVFFRVDASVQIGSGHMMRCLALAAEMKSQGADIAFIGRELPGHMFDFVEERGIRLFRLGAPLESSVEPALSCLDDLEQTLVILREHSPDWLVIDHYVLDATWERGVRDQVGRIMVIDDLADRPHDCDLLLDQNLYPKYEHRYDALVPPHCEKLLGPSFALLRPEFAACRGQLAARNGQIRNILLFFGGADAGNETSKALRAIRRMELPEVSVALVVGGSNPHRLEIEALCATMPSCTLHVNAANMAELMAEADLFIGAGGSTTWERCCLGLPSLVIAVADNQVATTSFCAEQGMCLYLGESAQVTEEIIAAALKVLLRTPETLRSFARESMRLVDGNGIRRVVSRLLPPEIAIRRATMDDCDAVHAWRNHEETRRFIFNPDPVPIGIHREWFQRALLDPNRVLLIGESKGRPVGVLRYDLKGESALISIYLVPGSQGRGVGTQLIRAGSVWIKAHFPQIKAIDAEILAINKASLRAFELAGFREHHLTYQEVLN